MVDPEQPRPVPLSADEREARRREMLAEVQRMRLRPRIPTVVWVVPLAAVAMAIALLYSLYAAEQGRQRDDRRDPPDTRVPGLITPSAPAPSPPG
ncbi:hypothetical protein [Nocardioides sp.]|uniref:hypothetical protein n=1 Tax=Nocardioides sp. TaxID=35761 RepID=UPI003519CDDA